MEKLAHMLDKAGSKLSDLPEKFQAIADNLLENFKKAYEKLQQTTQQSLSQNNESASEMKKQLDEMSAIIKYFYTIYS